MEFWTKWSDIRSVEFSLCNVTGHSRAIIKLDKEHLYVHCREGSNFSDKLKNAHLLPFKRAVLVIDESAIHHDKS